MNGFAPLATNIAGHFMACVVLGLLIAGTVGLLLVALRRKNASTRFAISLSALFTIFALALFSPTALHGGIAQTAVGHAEFTFPASWAGWFLASWAVISGLGLLRIALSLWHLHRVRKHCIEIDAASLDPVLRDTLRGFQSRNRVRLCVSDALRVPTAIGFFKPLVVFPKWALEELTPAELNSVLLHELAHLRRWDDWTNLAQRIIAALLFFHPAVWWLQSRLSLEREMACDDLVLHQAADSRQYAECLVAVAEKSALQRRLAFALGAIGRLRDTSRRLVRILDPNRPRSARASRTAMAGMAAFAVAALICVPHLPQLVAFQTGPQPLTAPDWNSTRSRTASIVHPASFVQRTSFGSRIDDAVARVNIPAHKKANATPARPRATSSISSRGTTPAFLRASASRSARVVRARSRERSRPSQVFLVIFHAQQFNSGSSPVYSLQVWRLALHQAHGAKEITMSAI